MLVQDKLPIPFNWLNRIGETANKIGVNQPNLNLNGILENASKLSGLTDFGDNHFLEGLDALVYSAKRDNINFLGKFLIRSLAVRCAQNRLEWVDRQKTSPEAFKKPLPPPIIVVGAPRSGTTIMHRMLAADPANQAIPMWRLINPFTPQKGRDNRLSQLKRDMKVMAKLRPNLPLKHDISPEKPEECIMIQGMTFNSLLFYASAPVYSYLDWYDNASRFKMYEEYASMLQWYQHEDKRRLTLKSPPHAADLTELFAAIPNALVVQTHRDPVKVVNSANSLFHTLHSFQMSSYDLGKMVDANMRQIELIYKNNLIKRKNLEYPVCDIAYDDLVQDPVGTTKKVYTYFGLDWTEEYENSLKQFMNRNPKDKFGKHKYSAEMFGLTDEAIRERFAEYIATYNV